MPVQGVGTFAISSLFLNAPSVNIASPFSSTSVQRSTGSRAALARLPVMLVVKMDVSSSSVLRLRKSGVTVLGPQSRSDMVDLPVYLPSVEASRRGTAALCATGRSVLVDRTRFRCFGRTVWTSKVEDGRLEYFRRSQHRKGIPSDWNRKYRSSLREGTAGANAERIAAIVWCSWWPTMIVPLSRWLQVIIGESVACCHNPDFVDLSGRRGRRSKKSSPTSKELAAKNFQLISHPTGCI